MVEWLFMPMDVARPHHVDTMIAWHARLMVLAWAILIPTGIIIARFFKIMPSQNWPAELDNKFWWHSHRALQYTGGAATLVAIYLILKRDGSSAFSGAHSILGWALLLIAALQFASGWLRGSKGGPTAQAEDGSLRGDHYDMTLRRKIFEYFHKSFGYIAALTGCITIVTGLWAANAPRWMALVIFIWWCLCLIAFFIFQRRGLTADTYQAIWGPDSTHPGQREHPIGWGIRKRF